MEEVPDLKSVIRENDHPQTQGQRHGPFTQWTTDSSQDGPSYVLKDIQRPSSLMQPEIPSSKQLDIHQMPLPGPEGQSAEGGIF